MTEPGINVRDGVYLSSVRPTDKPALLEHFGTRDISETTLNIPYPYTESDADSWLHKRIAHSEGSGKEVTFAVRDAGGMLIGVVGADSHRVGASHRAEIGYWLARQYWGRGLMTDAVRAYIGYAFGELRLLRLTAQVVEFNPGSARVLEKNGFKLEGRLRSHVRKGGKLFDVRFYGLLKEEALHS
ncbi:MAG TPA: GNAT family N-acetyltransferase [Pyrinomonadaceae bacterium]|jgi:RimJ/RimL family protein N-acetyltransferase